MDWDLAIKRNSEALAGIVETLFAMLGLVGEATVARLPWPTYRAVLRVLRPAESAMRRLIVSGADRKGRQAFPFLLSTLRSAQKLPGAAPTPGKVREESATHPFLRRRFPSGRPLASTPARGRSRFPA
jgi:hypothetical protein